MREPGNDDMKTRYFLAFLKEVEYVNKVIYPQLKYYACKWAALLAAAKYKSAIDVI